MAPSGMAASSIRMVRVTGLVKIAPASSTLKSKALLASSSRPGRLAGSTASMETIASSVMAPAGICTRAAPLSSWTMPPLVTVRACWADSPISAVLPLP